MSDDADGNLDQGAESRTKTYLANERTFLAWHRTAAALVALRLAAAQFLTTDIPPTSPIRRALAVAFVIASLLAVLAGLRRYRRAIGQIET